jgi:uncharacterized protein with GYD domain
MAHYIILGNFTEQGIKTVKDTVKRSEAFKAMAAKAGIKVHEVYWTLGAFDIVARAEGDEAAMTALGLTMGALGNVRTQTLRAFDAAEMGAIIAKMG